MSGQIRAEGLRELRSELRRVGPEMPRSLQRANKKVAADIVVPAAINKAQARPFPRPGSGLIGTIRATATQTSASVNMGGARRPYGFGHEFGAVTFRQFPPKQSGGYIIYPAIKEKSSEIYDAYVEVIDDLTKQAFPRGRL